MSCCVVISAPDALATRPPRSPNILIDCTESRTLTLDLQNLNTTIPVCPAHRSTSTHWSFQNFPTVVPKTKKQTNKQTKIKPKPFYNWVIGGLLAR